MNVRFQIPYTPIATAAGFLRVTEAYLCTEGEGTTIGCPTYLVRLSGCNLRCWWCDSKFSSFQEDEAKDVPWETLRDQVMESNAAWVSFTGGEPTWRPAGELAALARLCQSLRIHGKKIKVETNGLKLPEELLTCVDLWSISPKWDASKEGDAALSTAMHYDVEELRKFAKRFSAAGRLQFKFVICAQEDGNPKPEDLARVRELLTQVPETIALPVILVPEGLSKGADYLLRNRLLAEALQKDLKAWEGWDMRVLPQWHRVLYGEERQR